MQGLVLQLTRIGFLLLLWLFVFAVIRTLRADIATAGGMRIPRYSCLLYTSPSPRDATLSRMPSSA